MPVTPIRFAAALRKHSARPLPSRWPRRGLLLMAWLSWSACGASLAGCQGAFRGEDGPAETNVSSAGRGTGDDSRRPPGRAGQNDPVSEGVEGVFEHADAGTLPPLVEEPTSGEDPTEPDAGAPSSPPITAQNRDLTFFVTSDTHLGRPDIDATESSMTMIEAMHAAPSKPYPVGLGLVAVEDPSGVIITGDLTDDNRVEQWKVFDGIWEVNGAGAIRYPVFEGWGNHDFHSGREDVRAAMRERHLRRRYPVSVSQGNGAHYSWDFHDVHFVNLNLYPGLAGKLSTFAPNNNDPRQSLLFLMEDLERNVGDTGRPVVISFHYGFDANGSGAWVDSERAAFFEAIAPYNVVALFVGHSHAQGFTQVTSTAKNALRPRIDVYMADDTLSASTGGKTGFYVVHMSEKEIVVAERTVSSPKEWGFVRKASITP